MNIFATSTCPIESAMWLDDKRVVKMITESCQMLSTATRLNNEVLDKTVDNVLYKVGWQYHPATKWVIHDIANLNWLLNHADCLAGIYQNVYGKRHSCVKVLDAVRKANGLFGKVELRSPLYFCDCTEYKDNTDWSIQQRYRRFMILKWETRDVIAPKWTERQIPPWYLERLKG